MKYRVILKIGYYENWFEFDDVLDASKFARTVIESNVPNDDSQNKRTEVIIKVIETADTDDEVF